MDKHVLMILLVSACSLTASAQNLSRFDEDSLKRNLQTAKDTNRINALNILARKMLYAQTINGFVDSAETLVKEAKSLSQKLHFDKGLGNALLNEVIIGIHRSNDYVATFAAAKQALPLLKSVRDQNSIADCFGFLAECNHFLGNNSEAIFFYDSSLRLHLQLKDTVSYIWTMLHKGHCYFDLSNYNASYKTLHAAQDLILTTDTNALGYVYCQFANLFLAANLPEISIDYLNKIRALFPVKPGQEKKIPWVLSWGTRIGGEAFLELKQIDSAYRLAMFLSIPLNRQKAWESLFYGRLYYAMGEYEKAFTHLHNGYDISKHSSHQIDVAKHLVELANVTLALKKNKEAIFYAEEAIRISKKIQALREEKNATGILKKIYEESGDYAKFYQYDKLYKSLSDSVASAAYSRKMALIQVKDQLEIQTQQAQLLSNENELAAQQIKLQEASLKTQSLLNAIFIFALVAMALVVLLVVRNIRLNKRKIQLQQSMEKITSQQLVTELEKEKTELEMQALRAQMNPHFIFNCLSSINRYILINKTEEASDYLTKFSRLIRMALHNSEKPLITLEDELEALRLYLDLERLRFKNAFNYSITFINTIDVNTVYIPPMIIQPFAENAIWHGLMHKKGLGSLEIRLCTEDKMLTCMIIDNGIGRNMAGVLSSHSAKKNKSMGVEITAGRLSLFNKFTNEAAAFNIEDLKDDDGNDSGTQVILKMPFRSLTEVFD